MRFRSSVSPQGTLDIKEPEAWRAELRKHSGHEVFLELKRYRKIRSLNQNSFFHGPVLEHLAEWTGMTTQEVKDGLKERFLGVIRVLPNGKEWRTIRGTSELTTTEWEAFMEKVRAEFAQHGFFIPVPNESWSIE